MSDIKSLIDQSRSYYKSIVSTFCPILRDTVYFTSEGFNHLIYESNRAPRSINEQYLKLMCLKDVNDVISNCDSITQLRVERRKIRGKKRRVVSYELIHTNGKQKRVKVIVERVGNGKLKFRSIMSLDRNKRKANKKRR